MADTSFGKYRLIAELGHGGMADVFLAAMAGPAGSGFSKLAVVKRLRQNLAEDPEFVSMLVDEARIAARLNHPNVVQTNEVGQVASHYFIAMEYLDGQPFHRVQYRAAQGRKEGRDPFPRELEYLTIIDALAGLHHAHDLSDYDGTPLQIVHRDVTPHNIFITYEGQVKVVDFGIAKAVGRASETRQGVVKGKVRYMAPEQAIGQAVDRRADLFCVGILVWEAAAGRRMWKDMDNLQIVQALVSGDFDASPRSVNPDVPEQVDRICKKALGQRPDDRYATADEFRADLEQYLADAGLLIDARRRIGAAVADMFKDKRSEIKTVIERQLSELTARPSADFKAVSLPLDSQSTPSLTPSETSPLTVSVEDATRSAATDAAPTKLYSGQKEAGRSGLRRLAAVAVFGIAGTAAVAVALASRARSADAGRPVSAALPTIASEVAVSVVAHPAEAKITFDGQDRGNAFTAKMQRDEGSHRLTISAAGYRTVDRVVRLTDNVSDEVTLEKSAEADPPPPSRAPQAAANQPPAPRTFGAAPAQAKTAPTATATATQTATPPTATTTPRGEPSRRKREIDKNDPWANPTAD